MAKQDKGGYPLTIREEELKNKVAADFFSDFDSTRIIGNIDFCISMRQPLVADYSLLWAEAKKGNKADIYESFVQLILTIGRGRTNERFMPPAWLGAFDAEKIGFIPYNAVMDVFAKNDFNWNVTPSDHESKEFQYLYALVRDTIAQNVSLFPFADRETIATFIRNNFVLGKSDTTRISITKNNFTAIYLKWLTAVKPSIRCDWELAKKIGILDADFYLADILSQSNETIKDSLFVLLKTNHYEFDRSMDEMQLITQKIANFSDNQLAHTQFWNLYERPPREEFWEYIVARRDLLVPQDIRERKGSFFTPRQWVDLSQQYLADYLGDDWQDEYYIWDCAAGTGNLLAGLTNRYNVWASTLDKADVDVMKDRIRNGANLLESHVFQFDFLNDGFDKLPKDLREIIEDGEKRKKLVIYINPPYAEAATIKAQFGTGKNKDKVATSTIVYSKYLSIYGKSLLEIYIQFMVRIFNELNGVIIANFSKTKSLQSQNFYKFRNIFTPKLEKLFLVPSYTFDNVKGKFPIGFFIWDTKKEEYFESISADVFEKNGNFLCNKNIYSYRGLKYVIDWLKNFHDRKNISIAYLRMLGTDMVNNRGVFITNKLTDNDIREQKYTQITENNVIETAIYCSIRHVFVENWINDRDQFLYPHDTWKNDTEFQTNCLTFVLFTNTISISKGENNFIPFTEKEVDAKNNFASHFMTQYMAGKLKASSQSTNSLLDTRHSSLPTAPLQFSPEATAVFDAGRELWKYYHSRPDANPNAALYDIREYFQGRNDKGKMNPTSTDGEYNRLNDNLKAKLKLLAEKIAPKVYEHGFLLK